MPTFLLRTDVAQPCPQYSVVGAYKSRPFVGHAALLRESTSLRFGEEGVLVFHIGPPLIAGPQTEAIVQDAARRIPVHLVGFVELDADSLEGIETWLAEVDKEDRPLGTTPSEVLPQYRVSPAVYWVRAENGMPLYRQFSCVGFVMDCYRSIDINLIDDSDLSVFPDVSLDELVAAYGAFAKRAYYRDQIGIPGTGPWKVVLASYVFHSLNRDAQSIATTPYIPTTDAAKIFPGVESSAPAAAATPPSAPSKQT